MTDEFLDIFTFYILDTAIKDVRNLFRLEKEIDDKTVEDIKNL